MTEKRANVGPGFYARSPEGRYYEVGPADVVEVHICRRLADFPGACKPTGSYLNGCTKCRAWVVTDGTMPAVPILCMQCAGIEPLPFPEGER